MSGIGRYKLSDAIRPSHPVTGGRKGGKPKRAFRDIAEQAREAVESREARGAEASNRDRMVDIGRGNQQAGRQGS